MHEINLSDETHFYTDASGYEDGLAITQKRFDGNHSKEKIIEVSVLYDFFIFNRFQRKYFIYKKELCAMIILISKYDYLIKHFYQSAIIHTDHKSFTHFFISVNSVHEKIYEHWADKLRIFNVKIKYISDFRNKVADELFRTLFQNEECKSDSEIFQCFHDVAKWIWSDRKGEDYEHFFSKLINTERQKVIENGFFNEKSVFAVEMESEF